MSAWFVSIAMTVAIATTATTVDACPEDHGCQERPLIEWSSWLTLGASTGSQPGVASQLGGGLHATIGIDRDGDVRLGPWAAAKAVGLTELELSSGLELQLGRIPPGLDLFQWKGEGQIGLRAGVGRWFPLHRSGGFEAADTLVLGGARASLTADERFAELTLTYGYRTSWRLTSMGRDCRGSDCATSRQARRPTRYMIGARLYASAKRSFDGDRWSTSAGIELEPAGALRYLLLAFGFDGWYSSDLPWVRTR